MRRAVLAACFAIALPAAAWADQDPAPTQPGDRVRVRCFSGRPVIGTLVSASDEELVVERADVLVSLRRDAVAALDKSLGRGPRWSTRIAGALAGGVGGFAVFPRSGACAAESAVGRRNSCGTAWDTALDFVPVAVAAAAGFGAGSLFKAERWQPASRTALTVEAAPTRGGARVSLRLSF